MALQGGDREFGHGDIITVVYDDSTDAVGGEAVYVTGRAATGDHVTVELADNSNDPDGFIQDGATQGDVASIVLDGIAWVRVADADNVSASDTVGTDAGMTAGELTSSGSGYLVLEGEQTDSESGETIALVDV
jgi:hypothetical protein